MHPNSPRGTPRTQHAKSGCSWVPRQRAHFSSRGPFERIRGWTKPRQHPAPPGGLSRDPRHPQGAPGPRPRAEPGAPLAGAGSRQGAAREVPTLSSRRGVPALELAGPQLGPPVQQRPGEDARGGCRRRVAPAWPPGAAGKLWPWGR